MRAAVGDRQTAERVRSLGSSQTNDSWPRQKKALRADKLTCLYLVRLRALCRVLAISCDVAEGSLLLNHVQSRVFVGFIDFTR